MIITVEISLYPLDQTFGNQILEFIGDLKQGNQLKIRSNSMSTQITGEYDEVFAHLQKATKAAFQKGIKSVLVMKMFNEGLELDWLNLGHNND